MPSALKRTGSAAVRARVPDAVSGATKQLATRRDRPAIASTTAAAAEASAMLRVKDQTLKSRLHRGRLILRKQLADFAGGLSLHRPVYGT